MNTIKFLLAGVILVSTGCGLSAPLQVPDNTNNTTSANNHYVSFSIVTQEFVLTTEGIATINRMIDLHEQYNVPLDVIVDDASMQVYTEQAPDVIERLKNSPVVAVSYHTRPPSPYYKKFDFAGLRDLSETELYDRLLQYEEHGVDLVTGEPRTGAGGYQFVKDQIGYAPIMAGLITEPTFAPSLLKIYAEKGAQFVIEHRDQPIEPGQYRDDLMIRPETIPLIFTEHIADTPEQLITDQFVNAPTVEGPVFMSIKTHDNDFYATQSAWLSVYQNQGIRGTPQPPFDLSVYDEYAELLTGEEQADRWEAYTAAVQYAAEHQQDFNLINAKQLQSVISQQTDSSTSDKATITNTADTASIYVTIVSHNEEPGGGRGYPNFLEDEAAFWEQRAAIIDFAKQVTAAGAVYHWQSDWNFLKAVAEYDQGTADTNDKNVVRYLSEDVGISIDPHAHERFYNYADVAYLIQQLGVEPSHVVGGFLVWPLEQSKLEYLWKPITSTIDSNYTWQAEILWGGGSPNHQADYTVSGVWKPASIEQYLTHSETAPLPDIGSYTSTWEGLDYLLAKQTAGTLEPGIYTVTIMVNQDEMSDPSIISETVAQIQAHQAAVDTGSMTWATFEDIISIWQNTFNSEPTIYQTESNTSKANLLRDTNSGNQFKGSNTTQKEPGSCGDGICQPIEQKLKACAADC